RQPPTPTLFPYTTLFRSEDITERAGVSCKNLDTTGVALVDIDGDGTLDLLVNSVGGGTHVFFNDGKGHFTESKEILNTGKGGMRSEEHTSELQSRFDLVC